MVDREKYYHDYKLHYGMSHTRRDRILDLAQGLGMRVLDLGCSSGALGARIKERGNWVGGVELSQEAAMEAKQRLDGVWSFDIDKEWPADLQLKDLDVVIAAEVLEHVFDPVGVLEHVNRALKPGGSVVITTPNFMTWTNRLKFLVGRFRYEEQGMFDFGHIRWFTYRYLREVLERSGFRMTDERHIIFPGKLTPVLKHVPSVFAWQFVCKAKKV